MNFRRMSDAALAGFLKNAHDRLASHEVTCLDNALADDLAAGLAPLITAFGAVIDEAVAAETARMAVTASKQSQRNIILSRLAVVQTYLEATEGPKTDFDLCGFNYRKAASVVVAQRPTNLSGTGTSYGVIFLQFEGNNKNGSVVYDIWRRHGDEGTWAPHAMTRKQTFKDTPVTPGQYYEYKVRAVATTNTSDFSDSAVVYGVS